MTNRQQDGLEHRVNLKDLPLDPHQLLHSAEQGPAVECPDQGGPGEPLLHWTEHQRMQKLEQLVSQRGFPQAGPVRQTLGSVVPKMNNIIIVKKT